MGPLHFAAYYLGFFTNTNDHVSLWSAQVKQLTKLNTVHDPQGFHS